jgi:hypothetical protein
MTQILQTAINKLNQLSEAEQNAIATLINEELEWDNKFLNTQDKLSHLANEASEEYMRGETKPWDLK